MLLIEQWITCMTPAFFDYRRTAQVENSQDESSLPFIKLCSLMVKPVPFMNMSSELLMKMAVVGLTSRSFYRWECVYFCPWLINMIYKHVCIYIWLESCFTLHQIRCIQNPPNQQSVQWYLNCTWNVARFLSGETARKSISQLPDGCHGNSDIAFSLLRSEGRWKGLKYKFVLVLSLKTRLNHVVTFVVMK